MKLTLNRDVLIRALQLVSAITEKNAGKPILSNFLLRAEETGDDALVQFFATDYELSLSGKIPARVETEGAVCVNAKRLLDLSQAMRSAELELHEEEELWVSIQGGPARGRLPAVETSLYPKLDVEELPNRFSVSPKDLLRCIGLTLFAVLPNETRKNLSGVRLTTRQEGAAAPKEEGNGQEEGGGQEKGGEQEEGGGQQDNGATMQLAATDGHRLSLVRHGIAWQAGEEPPEVIAPRRALEEMRRMLGKSETDVELAYDERSLRLNAGELSLSTRLVDGKFPNVEAVIPQDMERQLQVDRSLLLNGLKLVCAMSDQKVKPVKFTLENGKVRLSSERTEHGEASDELLADFEGEAFEIGFNASYIMDVLEALPGEEKVQIEFKGRLNPCTVRSEAESGFISVVMPLRLEW